MSRREFSARYLEPGSMWLMILGIIFLCQPWIEILHQYSVTIMLIGLVGFNIAVHIPPPERKLPADVQPQGYLSAAPSRRADHG